MLGSNTFSARLPTAVEAGRINPRATPARPGRRAATGCPDHGAYLTVLGQAFARAGKGPSLKLHFGATSGEVLGAADARRQLVHRALASAAGLWPVGR